LLTDAR